MTDPREGRPRSAYRVECDGRDYVIYHSEAVGGAGHIPGKWYAHPYPIPLGLWAGEPFDTAEEAERSVRERPGPVEAASPLSGGLTPPPGPNGGGRHAFGTRG